MEQNDNLKKIDAIHRQLGEPVFRMVLQHLFDCGCKNFTDENVERAKVDIIFNSPIHSIIAPELQLEIVERSFELSRFSLWDLLLYIKLYIGIQGDDQLEFENAEIALDSWIDDFTPQKVRDAINDSHIRKKILREMVSQHIRHYTVAEVKDAVQ